MSDRPLFPDRLFRSTVVREHPKSGTVAHVTTVSSGGIATMRFESPLLQDEQDDADCNRRYRIVGEQRDHRCNDQPRIMLVSTSFTVSTP